MKSQVEKRCQKLSKRLAAMAAELAEKEIAFDRLKAAHADLLKQNGRARPKRRV